MNPSPVAARLLPALLVASLAATAQLDIPDGAPDTVYARALLDTLCAPGMHGRGYVAGGMDRAADFLAAEFDRLGLEPAGEAGWFQTFETPINTFPGELRLAIDGRELRPGFDFLVMANSPPVTGRFKARERERMTFPKDLESLRRSRRATVLRTTSFGGETTAAGAEGILMGLMEIPPASGGEDPPPLILRVEDLTWALVPGRAARAGILLLDSAAPAPIRSIDLDVESAFHPQYACRNIFGRLPGTGGTDSVLLVSAHYDHLGRMGRDTYFPGANDNASGVALLLALARHYTRPAHRPRHDLFFALFAAEEAGLVGSRHAAEHPPFDLDRVRFQLNLDICGTGDDGIRVVNGSLLQAEFGRLRTLNDSLDLLPAVKVRGEACNSDHCPFHERGVPAFFVYTLGGVTHYHDVFDRPRTLPLTGFTDLARLLEAFLDGF